MGVEQVPLLSLRTAAGRLGVIPRSSLTDREALLGKEIPVSAWLAPWWLRGSGAIGLDLGLEHCGALDRGLHGLVALALQLLLGHAEASLYRELPFGADAGRVKPIPRGLALAERLALAAVPTEAGVAGAYASLSGHVPLLPVVIAADGLAHTRDAGVGIGALGADDLRLLHRLVLVRPGGGAATHQGQERHGQARQAQHALLDPAHDIYLLSCCRSVEPLHFISAGSHVSPSQQT